MICLYIIYIYIIISYQVVQFSVAHFLKPHISANIREEQPTSTWSSPSAQGQSSQSHENMQSNGNFDHPSNLKRSNCAVVAFFLSDPMCATNAQKISNVLVWRSLETGSPFSQRPSPVPGKKPPVQSSKVFSRRSLEAQAPEPGQTNSAVPQVVLGCVFSVRPKICLWFAVVIPFFLNGTWQDNCNTK